MRTVEVLRRTRSPLGALLVASLIPACAAPSAPRTPETRALASPAATTAASTMATPSTRQDDTAPPPAGGGTDAEALAKKLANPIASLMSFPFQLNYDDDIGPSEGERWTLNIQPVLPFSIDEEWNVISRTILPIIDQEDIPNGEDEFGTGDILQSAFFSPVAPTESGWIWGAGPVLLIPTASDETLGTEKWGIGPTGVALKQVGPWTGGALVNHIWSFAGDDDRARVDQTFIQPFLSHTTKSAWTFAANLEATYDWRADQAAIPLNLSASKVVKLGDHLFSFGGGLRFWIEESDASPEGVGLRFVVTYLLPK